MQTVPATSAQVLPPSLAEVRLLFFVAAKALRPSPFLELAALRICADIALGAFLLYHFFPNADLAVPTLAFGAHAAFAMLDATA